MALFIVGFVVELLVASAIYYSLRRLFFKKSFVVLAVGASLIGLIAGWTACYRATGYDVTMKYLEKVNMQSQQARGMALSIEDEKRLKVRLFAGPEFEYLLRRAAAVHALPAFLAVLIIMVRRSKKHEKQYKRGERGTGLMKRNTK